MLFFLNTEKISQARIRTVTINSRSQIRKKNEGQSTQVSTCRASANWELLRWPLYLCLVREISLTTVVFNQTAIGITNVICDRNKKTSKDRLSHTPSTASLPRHSSLPNIILFYLPSSLLLPSAARLISSAFNNTSRYFMCLCMFVYVYRWKPLSARAARKLSSLGLVQRFAQCQNTTDAVTCSTRQFSLWCRIHDFSSICS